MKIVKVGPKLRKAWLENDLRLQNVCHKSSFYVYDYLVTEHVGKPGKYSSGYTTTSEGRT